MTTGLLLLILTGICWVGIAVVVSRAARKRLEIDFIQFAASLVIASAALCAMLFRSPLAGGSAAEKVVLCLGVLFAGMCNYLMIRWMRRAMVLGNCGAVWGITQSAMICPFLMGIFLFGVAPTPFRIGGLLLILLGIRLFSTTRPKRGPNPRGWLLPTLGAFAASGAAQCFANLPSYWDFIRMSSELRAALVQTGTIALFLATAPFRRKKLRITGTAMPILLLSLVQILSLFFFFYRGLNLVAEQGCGAIGYPVAQGSCIAGVLLYSRFVLKEPCSWNMVLAFGAVCGGIAVISISSGT